MEGTRCSSCGEFYPVGNLPTKIWTRVCPRCGGETVRETRKTVGFWRRLLSRKGGSLTSEEEKNELMAKPIGRVRHREKKEEFMNTPNMPFLWNPISPPTAVQPRSSHYQLADLVVVTNASPIRDTAELERMLATPPTPEMMAVMLEECPLTADHFRLSVPIHGTFAVWVLSREGNHSLVIPRGYGGPEGNFATSEKSDRPGLNLVTTLAQIILNRSVQAESALSVKMQTTHGDFAIFAFGVHTV